MVSRGIWDALAEVRFFLTRLMRCTNKTIKPSFIANDIAVNEYYQRTDQEITGVVIDIKNESVLMLITAHWLPAGVGKKLLFKRSSFKEKFTRIK